MIAAPSAVRERPSEVGRSCVVSATRGRDRSFHAALARYDVTTPSIHQDPPDFMQEQPVLDTKSLVHFPLMMRLEPL
jgi:hypothetical protein